MSLGSPMAWPTATPILEHRLLAMDGVRALDHLAQVHYHPNLNHPWVARLPEIRGLKPAEWAQQQRAFEENEERAAVIPPRRSWPPSPDLHPLSKDVAYSHVP